MLSINPTSSPAAPVQQPPAGKNQTAPGAPATPTPTPNPTPTPQESVSVRPGVTNQAAGQPVSPLATFPERSAAPAAPGNSEASSGNNTANGEVSTRDGRVIDWELTGGARNTEQSTTTLSAGDPTSTGRDSSAISIAGGIRSDANPSLGRLGFRVDASVGSREITTRDAQGGTTTVETNETRIVGSLGTTNDRSTSTATVNRWLDGQ